MTKEEAKEVLLKVRPCIIDNAQEDALDLAIDALSKPSLPSNLDEAVGKYLELPEINSSNQWEDLMIYDAFIAGAEWMAGQGVSMIITDETKWADVDKFVHSNCDGARIIQIRKKD